MPKGCARIDENLIKRYNVQGRAEKEGKTQVSESWYFKEISRLRRLSGFKLELAFSKP